MKPIILLDPSIGSENSGDAVIADSAVALLQSAGASVSRRIATHRPMSSADIEFLRLNPDHTVLTGGSNLLGPDWYLLRQWQLRPRAIAALRSRVIIWGAGWQMDRGRPRRYMKELFRSILRPDSVHRVRDSYTLTRFGQLAPDARVVLAGCPALVGIEAVRPVSGRQAIITLTNYDQAPRRDQALVAAVRETFGRVIFWAQADADRAYAESAGIATADQWINGGLESFATFLQQHPQTPVIGTRLHGALFAAQCGARPVLATLDIRTLAMAMDWSLSFVWPSHDRGVMTERVSTALEAPWAPTVSGVGDSLTANLP